MKTITKKIYTTTLLFSLFGVPQILFADNSQPKSIENLSDFELYNKGIEAYHNKNFDNAYILLNQYTKKALAKHETFFFLGRSAYEIGKYKDALNAYERVFFEDPKNTRVQLEIGLCYFQLKQYNKAKLLFIEILKKDIPTEVKKNILITLKKIEKIDNSNQPLLITLMLALNYDSNVSNDADSGTFDIYVPEFDNSLELSNDGEKESDSSLQMALVLEKLHQIRDNWSINNKLTAFTQEYKSLGEKDTDLISLSSALSTNMENNKLTLELSYDKIWLNSDSYQSTPNIKFQLERKLDSDLDYKGYFQFSDKQFKESENKEFEVEIYKLYNSLTLLSASAGTNSFTIILSKENQQHGVRTDINKRYYELEYSNSYNLTKTLLLKSQLDFKKTKYKDRDFNFLSKRKDREINFELSLIKTLNNNLSIGLNGKYTDNSSNQEPYIYDKYIIKTFLYYRF